MDGTGLVTAPGATKVRDSVDGRVILGTQEWWALWEVVLELLPWRMAVATGLWWQAQHLA